MDWMLMSTRHHQSHTLKPYPSMWLNLEIVPVRWWWALNEVIWEGPTFDRTSVLIMEKAMAPHSSTLAWKILWTKDPGGPQSMGLLRVRQDWATSLWLLTFMHWRKKWQPTPVFLPGESQGRGSLVGCHLWGHTESDMTEQEMARVNIDILGISELKWIAMGKFNSDDHYIYPLEEME